jgi:hypothetical protein
MQPRRVSAVGYPAHYFGVAAPCRGSCPCAVFTTARDKRYRPVIKNDASLGTEARARLSLLKEIAENGIYRGVIRPFERAIIRGDHVGHPITAGSLSYLNQALTQQQRSDRKAGAMVFGSNKQGLTETKRT